MTEGNSYSFTIPLEMTSYDLTFLSHVDSNISINTYQDIKFEKAECQNTSHCDY